MMFILSSTWICDFVYEKLKNTLSCFLQKTEIGNQFHVAADSIITSHNALLS